MRGIFFSVVANRRQPNPYITYLGGRRGEEEEGAEENEDEEYQVSAPFPVSDAIHINT